MSKMSKEEYLRSILNHGERIVYRANIHPSAYAVPVVIIIFGALLTLMPELLLSLTSGNFAKIFAGFLDGAGKVMFGAVIMFMGFVMIYQVYLQRKHNVDVVSTQRVIHISGAVRRKVLAIYLHKIVTVKAKQSMFERFMFRGRVLIEGEEEHEHIALPTVAEPKQFVEAVKIAIERFSDRTKIIEKENKRRKH